MAVRRGERPRRAGRTPDGSGDTGSVPPAAEAILGLLSLAEAADGAGDGYGYDLARQFGPGQPLAEIIHLEPGMLYHHLKRLDKAGWITGALEPQGSRPPRQVYRITPAGQEELKRWLTEPVVRTREIRLEFLVKLYFARRLDPQLSERLIAEQRETCLRLVASLRTQLDRLDADPAPERASGDWRFVRDVLALRLAQTEAAVGWLEGVQQPS